MKVLNDGINGLFELLGALLIWMNVYRILRDKMVRGVDWRVTFFFAAWGFWNLYYYPSLHQWLSTAGGVVMVIANVVWVVLAMKYRKN